MAMVSPKCALLDLGELRRRLPLGNPIEEGLQTILVERIVGTTSRSEDFDACWRPLRRHLRKRLDEIQNADPPPLLAPVDVYRVDQAYFVSDGHKRVAIARQTGAEFIDANVKGLSTHYHLEPGIGVDSVEVTAAEHRFRQETGLAQAAPRVRFHLWEARDYGELTEAVRAHAFEASRRLGRLLAPPEAAALWYEAVYLPTVRAALEHRVNELIPGCTDAYAFLWLHRQSRTMHGREFAAAEDIVRRVIEQERHRQAGGPSAIERLVRRAFRRREPAPQLLAEEQAAHPGAGVVP